MHLLSKDPIHTNIIQTPTILATLIINYVHVQFITSINLQAEIRKKLLMVFFFFFLVDKAEEERTYLIKCPETLEAEQSKHYLLLLTDLSKC